MTAFFLIHPIKSQQCTDKYSKKIVNSDFSSSCFDVPKMWNFTSGVVQNRDTKNRRLGMIVTSFQDFKLRGKQISQSFSYCELINSPRNGTKMHCLLENKKMSDSRKSWNDVTIIPSLLFLHPTESEISRFWHVKTGGKKIAIKFFFAILISTGTL